MLCIKLNLIDVITIHLYEWSGFLSVLLMNTSSNLDKQNYMYCSEYEIKIINNKCLIKGLMSFEIIFSATNICS